MDEPDEVGRQLKNVLIKDAFGDLKSCISNFESEIKISSNEHPAKPDVLRGLALLDDFYNHKVEYYKSQMNSDYYVDFLESVAEDNRLEMDRQMDNVDKLSESFRMKMQFILLKYNLDNADKDSKLRGKLNEFTIIIIFLTWALVEIDLLSTEQGIDLFFCKANHYLIALIFLIFLIFYALKAFRDSL